MVRKKELQAKVEELEEKLEQAEALDEVSGRTIERMAERLRLLEARVGEAAKTLKVSEFNLGQATSIIDREHEKLDRLMGLVGTLAAIDPDDEKLVVNAVLPYLVGSARETVEWVIAKTQKGSMEQVADMVEFAEENDVELDEDEE